MKKIIIVIILSTLLGASCKKTNTPSPTDQLPPTTQTGANTFGCLVNGKVYIPKGSSGNGSPNPKVAYDIGLGGRPVLKINADQYVNNNNSAYFTLNLGNLDHLGYYSNLDEFHFLMGWLENIGNCGTVVFDTTIQKWGGTNVTKLDIPNHIVSGTFNCKYKSTTCDTVFITDGRFDFKF